MYYDLDRLMFSSDNLRAAYKLLRDAKSLTEAELDSVATQYQLTPDETRELFLLLF